MYGLKFKKGFYTKILFIIFFLSTILAALGIIYLIFSGENDNHNSKIFNNSSDSKSYFKNTSLNVLLLGIDTLHTKHHGRSDAVMVISLNLDTKDVKIISLMRDTWVRIEGHGSDRLNAAYAFGGADLTIKTINDNFKIKIDRYVSIDFLGFEKIVNSIGGITLNLSKSEIDYINRESKNKNLKTPGLNRLDGNQTLQYVRDRNSPGSDIDRTQRQRNFIKALLKEAPLSDIRIIKLIFGAATHIKTNFSIVESIRIFKKIKELLNHSQFNIQTFRIPPDGSMKNVIINGKQVLVMLNQNKIIEYISKIMSKDNS